MAILTSILLAVLAAFKAQVAALEIIPGATWTDDTGKPIEAHGTGIIEANGTYYMIGEDKTKGTFFQNVNCYSSKNLVEWKYEGALLSRTDPIQVPGDPIYAEKSLVERPKVLFNEGTKKYVMYFHLDQLIDNGYPIARVAVASSDTVCGKYTYHGSFRPDGKQIRDIGLFKDTDGSAYLLAENREFGTEDWHSRTHIMSLSPDYLNVTGIVHSFPVYEAESPAMLKKDGHYFIFSSRLKGWEANDNTYSYAPSLTGPWSDWKTFALGARTWDSQVTYIQPLGNNVIYMGDRYEGTNLAASTYVWLPLTFDGTKVTLDWKESWSPDVLSGTWSERQLGESLAAEKALLENGAKLIDTGIVGYIGGPGRGSVTFRDVQSPSEGRKTIIIRYWNRPAATRFANIEVNGESQTLAFLSTQPRHWEAGRASLHCNLKKGSNTIVISTKDGSWGPDIERLVMPN